MKYRIDANLIYDGTNQGNTDRDNFKSKCDTELAKSTVVANIIFNGLQIDSDVVVTGDNLKLTIFYDDTNNGILDYAAFGGDCESEYAKGTVQKITGCYVVRHKCSNDEGLPDISVS